MPPSLPSALVATLEKWILQFDQISTDRRQILAPLVSYILRQKQAGESIRIIVICTHNSRRSHIGQLCLEVAAKWYGLENITTFSGGTEATAFNHRAVKALWEAGFPLVQKTKGENPIYRCDLGQSDAPGRSLFSKKFDSPPNPVQNFIAIMVCEEAAEACPIVRGAAARFSIPFEDPKKKDGQPGEAAAYAERIEQIGREFFWVIQQVMRNQ